MKKQFYSSDLAKQEYDAIIIGSGLGGLTTAAFLARYGRKVLILERHDTPGGFTHTFTRRGYEWDVGVHYVGGVNDAKNMLRKVFDYITDGKLKWEPMGRVYDRVIMAGKEYEFVAGREEMIAQMIRYFPAEEVAIRKYFELINGFPLSSGLFFGERTMPRFVSFLFGWFMRRGFVKRARRTTYEVLRELTANEELIAVLCAQCGDYGLPPRQSSFAIHAGLVDHYIHGGNYPVGGARAIYEAILAGIEERGGALALKAEVEKVIEENGRAVAVRMRNGDVIRARRIISNAGARNTFLRLWPETKAMPEQISRDLEKINPSVSHVCLYVGVKGSAEELNLPKCNYWVYRNSNLDGEYERLREGPSADPMLTYVSFPSAKDPAWAAKHPGKSTVQVIAPCPYEWVQKWENTQWLKRGPEYMDYKKQWETVLLERLYQIVPQLRGRVDYCELSTPLSTRHFSNYAHGEIYGLEHTPERMLVRWLRAHTPLKNFFMTGQDIIMVGVGGALMSGVTTAAAVLHRNVMWRVMRR